MKYYIGNSLSFILYDYREKHFSKFSLVDKKYKIVPIEKIEIDEKNIFIKQKEFDDKIENIIMYNEKQKITNLYIMNDFINKKRHNEYQKKSNDNIYMNDYTNDLLNTKEFQNFFHLIYKTINYQIYFLTSIRNYRPFTLGEKYILIRIMNNDKSFNYIFHETEKKILIFDLNSMKQDINANLIRVYDESENFKIVILGVKLRNNK